MAAVAGLAVGVAAIAPWTVPASRSDSFAARARTAEGALADSEGQVAALDGRVAELEEDVARLDGDFADTAAARDDALAAAEALEGDVADLEGQLARGGDRIVELTSERDGARAAAEAALADDHAALEAEIAAREAEVAAREGAVGQAEQTAEMSMFGSGVFRVGIDVLAGRYVSDGQGDGCYWARLSADGEDIIDNHFGSSPAVATLRDGELFETERCGTWTREP